MGPGRRHSLINVAVIFFNSGNFYFSFVSYNFISIYYHTQKQWKNTSLPEIEYNLSFTFLMAMTAQAYLGDC